MKSFPLRMGRHNICVYYKHHSSLFPSMYLFTCLIYFPKIYLLFTRDRPRACRGTRVDIRGQLAKVSFLLSSRGSQGENTYCPTWQHHSHLPSHSQPHSPILLELYSVYQPVTFADSQSIMMEIWEVCKLWPIELRQALQKQHYFFAILQEIQF